MTAADPPPRLSFAATLAFELSLGGLAWLLAWLLGMPLGLDQPAVARPLAEGMAAATPLAAALVVIDRLALPGFAALKQLVRRFVVPLFQGFALWQLLLVSLAAGWGEELLFRGVLQPWLARWTGSLALGVLLASLLFGAVHALSRSYFVLTVVMGGYFGGLAIASASLWSPIAAHAAYDFFALVYLRQSQPPLSGEDPLHHERAGGARRLDAHDQGSS